MLRKKKYPLLEFDNKAAVIEPSKVIKKATVPEYCVLTFFQEMIRKLKRQKKLTLIKYIKTEMTKHPVYKMKWKGKSVVVLQAGLGAPLSGGILEELIATGCKKFVACGGAGVLDSTIERGVAIIPVSALREEGTSFHYQKPSREIKVDKAIVQKLESVLKKNKVKYIKGKTWTTDAFYRETHDKVKLRRSEGCITVEMECSAFLAIAKYRNVKFGQLLYSGDDVSGKKWDPRDAWSRPVQRESLFWLAMEACLTL